MTLFMCKAGMGHQFYSGAMNQGVSRVITCNLFLKSLSSYKLFAPAKLSVFYVPYQMIK